MTPQLPLPVGFRATVIAFLFVVACLGCRRDQELPATRFNVSQAVEAAMNQLDRDQNRILDKNELAGEPGLLAAMAKVDSNSDKAISAEELASRLETYNRQMLPVIPFMGNVTLDGRPLADATVTLEPEPFLANQIPSTSGKTNKDGYFRLILPDQSAPGVRLGMYRMRISALDEAKKEIVPASHNSQTIVGFEIAEDVPEAERGHSIKIENR